MKQSNASYCKNRFEFFYKADLFLNNLKEDGKSY